MKQLILWFNLWLVLLVGSGHFAAAQPVSKTYAADNATNFPNPERGMWMPRYPIEPGTFSPLQKDDLVNNIRLKNYTLVHCRYIISDYRGRDLDARVLDQFRNDLATCREAGVKMVPLFMYNHGSQYGEGNDDAPKDRILRHLDQLGEVMRDNGDVIAYFGGGFIGQYGEWHSSTNNLLGNCIGDISAGGKEIINKMFAVLPANRAVVFRLTGQMQSMFGTEALTASEAFNGTNKARAGFKNHYFMGINNDAEGWATVRRESNGSCSWDQSAAAIAREKAYVHQQCSYAPAEAESDTDVDPATDPRHAGYIAIEQMKVQRISTCNPIFNSRILNRWKSDGVYDEIERNLGYRFQLTAAALPQQAAPGSTAAVSFTVRNTGYAAPYNPHGLELVLRSGSTVRRLALAADPRRWLPENGEITVTENVALPTDLPAGQYELLLNLPDPTASLNTRPEYAIRLANQDTWEAATGYNKLGHTLTVSGATTPNPVVLADGLYKLTARHSGKALQVNGGLGATADGVVVEQGTYSGATSQQWQLTNTDGGYCKLTARHSGKALDVNGGPGATDNGASVLQWQYGGGTNQQWQVTSIGDGYYKVTARHSGKALDVAGGPGATADGTPVHQWDYVGGTNQQWLIEPVTIVTAPPAAAYYLVRNRWQGTYLYENSGRVSYASTAGGDAYQWSLETADGHTQFRNKATGLLMVLDTNEAQLWCAATQPDWWSKDWIVETLADGFKRIRNRWQSTEYLHVGNLRGFPEHSAQPVTSWASHWSLDPVAAGRSAAAVPATAPALLSVFPNPSPDGQTSLQIQAAAAQVVTVQVRDGQGQLVSLLTVPVKGGTTVFRVPVALAHGLYFVLAKVDGQAQRFTLQVE